MNTLLFDIDGTLLSTQNAGTRTIDQVLNNVFQITRRTPLRLHGRTDRGILNDLLLHHQLEVTEEHYQAFRSAYLPLLDQHLQQYPSTILPGVVELLHWLGQRDDVALGILTGNMLDGAALKLSHSRLSHHFHFGGYGDQHPLRDDVAREAHAAAKSFLGERFRENQVWVIGDTQADVTCARAINANVIGVLTGGASREDMIESKPDLLLEDLSDAITVFQGLLDNLSCQPGN